MKKLLHCVCFLLAANMGYARQTEGKITYQLSIDFKSAVVMSSSIDGNGGITQGPVPRDIAGPPPQTFELSFGNNKMIWKKVEDELPGPDQPGGMAISMGGGGGSQEDIIFCDLTKGSRVHQRNIFGKQYLVEDSINRLEWIMSSETKSILSKVCRKATAEQISKVMRPVMKEGKFENEEVADTVLLVAWFAVDMPVAAGPEIQCQLPGVILELEKNRGSFKQLYKAIAISSKVDLAGIKAPAKGKKITGDEMKKEMEKMMKDMRRRSNNRSGVSGSVGN